jgi:hypothetical protein
LLTRDIGQRLINSSYTSLVETAMTGMNPQDFSTEDFWGGIETLRDLKTGLRAAI